MIKRLIKHHLLINLKRVKHVSGRYVARDRFLHEDVAYFSQWESPELNDKILKHEIDAADDPNWRQSGARSKAEYVSWSWAGCGMACTKMLVAHLTGKIVPLVELGKRCAEYDGYQFPLETSPGLYHKPYVTFLKKEFGWHAKTAAGAIIPELLHELSQGHYVIAGVSPEIRRPELHPKTKGGHLILLLGYDKPKRELYFHNPSGDSAATQAYATISFRDFKKFFSGRAIIITPGSPAA